jgi:CheY-like chemotaxis protein
LALVLLFSNLTSRNSPESGDATLYVKKTAAVFSLLGIRGVMTSNGTILVIEDQQSARESLAELLRGEGYEVHEAADGNSGIALVDQLDLDLVLTDLLMPGADGIAVLRHVREISPQTLVILMTGHASQLTPYDSVLRITC